ncbi:MAG: hypothetical protein HQL67_12690 [Magnetococcales bacterium]|nr:hypothetical protein [Magnetococcales bacterium]
MLLDEGENHVSTKKTPNRLDDPDVRNAEIALHRAAKKAQQRARDAGLEPVVSDIIATGQPSEVGQKN